MVFLMFFLTFSFFRFFFNDELIIVKVLSFFEDVSSGLEKIMPTFLFGAENRGNGGSVAFKLF